MKMAASKEVSAMIKQGFLPDTTLCFSPSRPPNSPPPPPPHQQQQPHYTNPPEAARPTLFQMMSEEQAKEQSFQRSQSRIVKIMREFESLVAKFGGLGAGDVRVTVVGTDGFSRVSLDVHKRVLLEKSGFFREKLGVREKISVVMHSVEICDCDDVDVYLETLVLMYCDDLKKRLIGEGVPKVLALLKVSAAIMFDAGISSCLEYLEAVPWSDNDEENIVSQLTELQLCDSANNVLRRISSEVSISARGDEIVSKLISGVLQAKDDKARREMKALISRLLGEDSSNNDSMLDVSKETFYSLCHRCLSSLVLCLSEATSCVDDSKRDRGVLMSEIAREADNLQWVVEILINRKICDEFVMLWADQKELAVLHSKIPTLYRHEVSKITAQICVAIGRGLVLVPKETRFSLLATWLEALYEDFGWMRRASRYLDRKIIEDGLSQTILTLPLQQQQVILLNWFDRVLNKGDDCPNIQRAFEVWWRRAFIRLHAPEEGNSQLQITVRDYPN